MVSNAGILGQVTAGLGFVVLEEGTALAETIVKRMCGDGVGFGCFPMFFKFCMSWCEVALICVSTLGSDAGVCWGEVLLGSTLVSGARVGGRSGD